MRILVIVADDVRINSSANLCHIAYIRGMVELGYEVELLCADKKSNLTYNEAGLPKEVVITKYNGYSLYETLAKRRRVNLSNNFVATNKEIIPAKREKCKKSISFSVKCFIRSFYGIYGFDSAFIRRAMAYKSHKEFDLIISMASPNASHYLAKRIINKGKVKYRKWIQIWEDPWSTDLYEDYNPKYKEEEERLISFADSVCYVSPLTYHYQQILFPKYSNKMIWNPLPFYYESEDYSVPSGNYIFGYFGDYFPFSRDLSKFVAAAKEKKICTYICGNPYGLFEEDSNVHFLPRMEVSELKQYEDIVSILVFVCNLRGGQIPGKIYQYSGTNKKILFILDGTDEEKRIIKEYFSSFNRYYFCDNTINSICGQLDNIVSNAKNEIIESPVSEFKPTNVVLNILKKARIDLVQ